jgi:nucleoid DNA-binding protein
MAAAAKGGNNKPLTKSQFLNALAEPTGLSRKQVGTLFTTLGDLIAKQLGKKGPGILTIPGLMKVKVVRKPATKEREGINPFTKEKIMIKAKPARNVVKIQPVKALKAMV